MIVGNTVAPTVRPGPAFFHGSRRAFSPSATPVPPVVEGASVTTAAEYMTGTVVVLGPTGRNFACQDEQRHRLRARRAGRSSADGSTPR